ncbi:MAG: PepSY-like domain-containing protein, partial [Alistipes sp.]|nr:PepSY-like domain-containing protein [Alistipes sp.]
TIMDKGIVWDEYTVVFVSGTKLDFDDDGKWLEVNCRYSEVPAAIVPNQISDYVKSYYPKSKITEIKRERNEWEVKLTGGLELTFNSSFRLTDMDD